MRYILLIHDLSQVHGCFATFPWLFVKLGSCTSYSLSFSNKKKINNDKLFHAVNTGGIRIQLCIYMSVVLVCWLAVMLTKLSLVHLGKLQLTWCVIFFWLFFLKWVSGYLDIVFCNEFLSTPLVCSSEVTPKYSSFCATFLLILCSWGSYASIRHLIDKGTCWLLSCWLIFIWNVILVYLSRIDETEHKAFDKTQDIWNVMSYLVMDKTFDRKGTCWLLSCWLVFIWNVILVYLSRVDEPEHMML